MNETGKVVDAKLNELRVTIRVAMSDATSCLYSGLIKNDAVRGGYSCYSGGATIEQGSWRAPRRHYPPGGTRPGGGGPSRPPPPPRLFRRHSATRPPTTTR